MTRTTLSFKTENQSVWGADVPVDRLSTEDRFIQDISVNRDIGFDIGILRLDGDLVFEGRVGLEAYVNLATAGTFDAAAELMVDLDYTRAVYTGDGGPISLTFDFSDYSYGRTSINHLGFGLGEDGEATPTVGVDLILELDAGLRDFSFWAGLPAIDLDFLGETPEITIYEADVGDFDFPKIDERIPLFDLGAGDTLFEYESKNGVFSATLNIPAGAKIDEIANGLSKVEGEGVSPVKFIEAEIDIDKLFTEGLKSLRVTSVIGKRLEQTIFREETYDINDYLSFIPEGELSLGITALDLGAVLDVSVKERASLDLTNNGADADVAVSLVFDPTPLDTSDNHLNTSTTTKLGQVHTFDLNTASAGAISTGIGSAQVTARYSLKAEYELGMGLDVRGALTVTALKAEFSGTLFDDEAKFEISALDARFPEDGVGFDFIIPGISEYTVSDFNTVTEVYDVAYSDFAPSGYDPDAPDADDELLRLINDVKNSSLFSLTELLGGETGDFVDATNRGSFDAVQAASEASPTGAASVVNTFYFRGGYTTLTSWDNSDWLLWEIPTDSTSWDDDITSLNSGIGAGVRSSFERKLQLLHTYDPDAGLGSGSSGYQSGSGLDSNQLLWREDVIGRTPGVNVISGSGDDLIAYNSTFYSQYFDGGDGHDIFVADLSAETRGRDVVINALDWGAGSTIPTFYPHETLHVDNFEGFFIKLGTGNDKVVIPLFSTGFSNFTTEMGQSFVDTGGGNDFVSNDFTTRILSAQDHNGDISKDVILLGAGDDLAHAYGTNANNISDFYAGGDGLDQVNLIGGRAIGNTQFNSSDRAIGINIQAADGTLAFSGQGITGNDSFSDIGRLLRAYSDSIVDAPGDLARFALTDGSYIESSEVAAVHYTHGRDNDFGSTVIFADVEAIGARVNSGVSNIALFTGATGSDAYVGSAFNDVRNPIDLFVADFAATKTLDKGEIDGGGKIARLTDIENVSLDISSASNLNFVNSSGISGFDRLYVRGTDGNDRFIGSGEISRADYINGGAGNDFIDGGDDRSADLLIGESGSDIFMWSNDGLDTVRGGEALGNESIAEIDWLIIGDRDDTSVTAGLNYRYTANVFNLFINNAPVRNAESNFGDLWGLLNSDPYNALSVFNIGYGTGLGVEFISVEKTNVVGSAAYDDLVVYQQGTYYDMGERDGDADVFVGKFTNSEVGITFTITDNETTGQTLENGTEVIGADRAMLLGSANRDNFTGGALQDFLHGGDGDDTLDGGAGDDLIRGGNGDDVIRWRGEGNATVEGGNGHDNLIIGNADEQLTSAIEWQFYDASGAAETGILGGTSGMFELFGPTFEQTVDERADIIIGGNKVNVLGVEGISVIGSDLHSDLFIHDEGILYFGGRGTATDTFAAILSDVTDDLLLRADGRDAYNNVATEPVYWSIGDGSEIAEMERFILLSGQGNDRIVGGASDYGDLISGNAGNDTLETGGGLLDRLEGNTGDDLLIATKGTSGADFFGQEGIDTFVGEAEGEISLRVLTDVFTHSGEMVTAAGFDLATAQSLMARLSDTTGINYFSDALSLFKLLTIEKYHLTAGAGDDVLLAAEGNSVLFGGAGDDVLLSRAGNDVLIGEAGLDTYVFDADFGDDVIAAEDIGGGRLMFTDHARADLAFTAQGNDLIVTASGGTIRVRDYFQTGGNGANFEIVTTDATFNPDLSNLGGAVTAALARAERAQGDETSNLGAEFLETSTGGSDAAMRKALGVVQGQDGDDQIVAFEGADVIDGGEGNDAVYYSESSAGVRVDLATGLGSAGAAEGDLYLGVENVIGSEHADTLTGNGESNFLNGDKGRDVLSGNAGADEVFGGGGEDTVDGGSGDDALSGGLGADSVLGGSGNDLVSGQQGDDTLMGGEGDDAIFGGNGNDALKGDAGNDTLYGDAGSDTLDGGAGLGDRADYTTSSAAVQIDLNRMAQTGGHANGDILMNIEDAVGSAMHDILRGTDAVNMLGGQAGDDLMYGRGGSDFLAGGDGNDSLNGGEGADVLWSGAQDDVVYGDDFQISYALEQANQIFRLYQATFNRTPDAAGHMLWTSELSTGAQTLAQVRDRFVNSQEFRNKYEGFSDGDFVKEMYINVLDRDFDQGEVTQAEVDSWTSQLNATFTRADLVNGFAESRQLINKTLEAANALAINSEVTSWSDDVYRLYRATLDRDPDQGGFTGWAEQLSQGADLTRIIAGFTNSAEFANVYGALENPTDFVTLLYNNVLDRAPDAAGLNGWLEQMADGLSREEVVQGFSQSAEFRAETAPELKQWVRDLEAGDDIDGGAGENLLAGGLMADHFNFAQEDEGAHTIIDLEAWDFLSFEGFGYTDVADVRAQFTQTGSSVVFDDQGTTVTLRQTAINDVTDDMILI
ncbi:DUF4214 domain-containing protein [uncultured Sulfitobacter sp.]|uniref:DUF4214 domain-containing protein n=1 Tax=uncultured Sulfitobacter sp. TaxID=191468 RepID=UPI00260EEB9A|nr:DUF4214 domain-containing protein [uncultured Sulfitobacter sp.]